MMTTIKQKSWKYIYDANSNSEDELNAIALIDLNKKYTYREMFNEWEKYASVFSALGIDEEHKSRIAIFDSNSLESSFAIYGANMTGASIAGFSPSCLASNYPLDKTIKAEGITDILLNDLVVNKSLLERLRKNKRKYGIRNIIVVKVSLEHEKMDKELIEMSEQNYASLLEVTGIKFMDKLIKRYKNASINYAQTANDDDAFIFHTSGTTKGISKPVPLSDNALNSAAEAIIQSGRFGNRGNKLVVMSIMVATSVYGFVDQIHTPLAAGFSVIVVPFSNANLLFSDVVSMYGANILFSTPFYFEMWNNAPNNMVPDFTTVKCVVIGGAYMSAEAKQKFRALIRKHGGDPLLVNGYGMSEVGGACIVQTDEVDDDSIGYPLPGVNIKIYDESEEKYYNLEDKHTGVLLINSEFISLGKIDDTEFFPVEMIDGLPYINTYDVVKIDDNGMMTCLGRANRFFVNNDGIKFDAGLIDVSISAEKGIEACALVPWFDKLVTADTVPVLYVKTTKSGEEAIEIVKKALANVFITKSVAKKTNLPVQCVIADFIPRNANGKVDIYSITNGGVDGDRYIIRPIYEEDELVDVQLELVENATQGIQNGAIPKEMEKLGEEGTGYEIEDTVLNQSITKLTSAMMGSLENWKKIVDVLEFCSQALLVRKNSNIEMFNKIFGIFGLEAVPQIEEQNSELTPQLEKLIETFNLKDIPYLDKVLGPISKLQKIQEQSERLSRMVGIKVLKSMFEAGLEVCEGMISKIEEEGEGE